jgi:hypothetical protein
MLYLVFIRPNEDGSTDPSLLYRTEYPSIAKSVDSCYMGEIACRRFAAVIGLLHSLSCSMPLDSLGGKYSINEDDIYIVPVAYPELSVIVPSRDPNAQSGVETQIPAVAAR